MSLDLTADIIDSRDILDRMDALEGMERDHNETAEEDLDSPEARTPWSIMHPEEAEELAELRAIVEEAEGSPGWRHTMDAITRLYAAEDRQISDFDSIEAPRWIEQDIDCSTVASILESGCASGAYMPAVTYWKALETMGEYGDDVLQYIEDAYGDLPPLPGGESWAGMAVFYLSTAVELWASNVGEEVASLLEEEEDA